MNYGKKIALFRPPSRNIESESVLSFDDLEDDDKDNVKRKTRNLSEKKRRDQFNVLISELCSMVSANAKKMDKSTVLKSAIQFLRNHQEFSVQSAANEIKENWKPTFLSNEEFAHLMLEAVESFLVVFTQQGKVLFASDSVTSLLGHLPSDLISHSLYDFMHEDDRAKFYNLLSKHQSQGVHGNRSISFTGHLRRGTIDLTEPATYERVKLFGTSQLIGEPEDNAIICDNVTSAEQQQPSLCFCCTVHLQTSHIIREMSTVDEVTNEFTSRHSLEWKFLFLDHRAPPIIGYLPFEVLGTSGYDYYHPDDLEAVSKCHEQLILMGKGRSTFYRFLTKGQQWIWLQTRYFVTYHQWNSRPEFIVCTNTVVGYSDVRRHLRQDMGNIEGTAVNSTTSTGSECLADATLEGRPPQEGHVTSLSQSEHLAPLREQIVQSPDVASSEHSDGERSQKPHSTKQESSSRRHVSSHLQSLLQLHLQRSLATSSSSSSHAANTPDMPSRPSGTSQAKVKSLSHPAVMSSSNQLAGSQARDLPSLVPLMTAMSTSFGAVTTNQNFQRGLVLTPAQQLLHEQLVQKSEQLQTAIHRQQEELRLIKEQLAYGHGAGHMVSQQQQVHQQQQQSSVQQQFILQQHLGLHPQSMLLSPAEGGTAHFALMNTNSSHIFLSPTDVSMDMQAQPQQNQASCQLQKQQIVLHHDTGLSVQPVMFAPTSQSQIFLSSAQSEHLPPRPQQQHHVQQQLQHQGQQQSQQQHPEQSLHFLGLSSNSSEHNSNSIE